MQSSNHTYNFIGILILWMTWLAFNSGSSLSTIGKDGLKASMSLVNTSLAPMTGGFAGLFFKKYLSG
jgi:ammonia channel protein AmtB